MNPFSWLMLIDSLRGTPRVPDAPTVLYIVRCDAKTRYRVVGSNTIPSQLVL